MPALVYFAYGSNMLGERLRRRCPTARSLGLARLDHFSLAFDKAGRDRSGKATILPQAETAVFGVLFTLDLTERAALDAAEGLGRGYDRIDEITVTRRNDGQRLAAMTYIAPPAHRDAKLKSFDWYRGLVLAGAHQNELPEDYRAWLAAAAAMADPDPSRPGRLEALQVLAAAGYAPDGSFLG
ncbi:gamma-glutamylcyclotransferase [Martelella alba]|uniref:Gamma-glutamylcyclotransferase n=1 Tax=Martelella alba TaxID=2590451 RepID=A0A506UDJ8_9HYPH|nr:gamma-glutamylcyclotransferase family protein [Martelella alba]TPW32512.1 gamma-glutamylcyclotransferase [Martelella alba]